MFINRVTIGGRVKTVEPVKTRTGRRMVRFILQCGKEEIPFVAFNDIAKWASLLRPQEYLEVGGRIQNNLWQDREGNTQGGIQIVAEHLCQGPEHILKLLSCPAFPGARLEPECEECSSFQAWKKMEATAGRGNNGNILP